MNRTVAAFHFFPTDKPENEIISLLNKRVEIRHLNCDQDLGAMAAYIEAYDGQVDAIALVGVTHMLRLGSEQVPHEEASRLFEIAQKTPVLDGQGLLPAVERWGVSLVDEIEPGFWTRKRVLMVPGLNHPGLVDGLSQFTHEVRYADPIIFFGWPGIPGVGSKESLGAVAERTLSQLATYSFQQLQPRAGDPARQRSDKLFEWADILAGDIGSIRRYSPHDLRGKIVVTTAASRADAADLTDRGAAVLVSLLPNLSHDRRFFAHHGPAELEACLAALRPKPDHPLNEHTYLSLLTRLEWLPAVRYLQPDEAHLNRFAFVAQPLSIQLYRQLYPWTQYLPSRLLERTTPYVPPIFLGRIRQITSPATDHTAEGLLFMLGGPPDPGREREGNFIYRRLLQAAQMAERLDARLLGVSAYVEAMGEAAERVSHKTDIAVTSGRSLSLVGALEAAKSAVQVVRAGEPLNTARVVVLNAGRPDAASCARYLAADCPCLTLIAHRPEHLIGLQREIEQQVPQAEVTISTSAETALKSAHLVVNTLPAGERIPGPILDLSLCQPGTVICDFGRPPLISQALSARRPDLVIIHDAEFRLPGSPAFDLQLGRLPGLMPAALAETALLALEGRFENFSLDRDPSLERLLEIRRLAETHQFINAGPRHFNRLLTREDLGEIRERARELRQNPRRQTETMAASRAHPAAVDAPQSSRKEGNGRLIIAGLGLFALLAGGTGWLLSQKKRKSKSG